MPGPSPSPPLLRRKASAPVVPGGDFAGFRQALQDLLALAVKALPEPAPARAFVNHGLEVPWDDCCSGQVWTRLLGVEAAGTATARTVGPCGPPYWKGTVGIGVLRCASTVSETGAPPPPGRMTWDAARAIEDAGALERALRCDWPATALRLTLLSWEPLGVLGGCAGGEWTATLASYGCGCP